VTNDYSIGDRSPLSELGNVSGLAAALPGVSGEELVKRAKVRYAHRPWFGHGDGSKEQSANWVRQAYRDCGMTLPSTSHPNDIHLIPKGEGISPSHPDSLAGNEIGPSITRGRLKPGDLVFFANTVPGYPPGVITHVGIYAGHGMMLDRGSFQNLVQLRSLDTFRHFVEGRRPKVLRDDNLYRTAIDLLGGKVVAKLNGRDTEDLTMAASAEGQILVNHEPAHPTLLTVEINAGGWHKGYIQHGRRRFVDMASCEVMFSRGKLLAQVDGQEISPTHVKFEIVTPAVILRGLGEQPGTPLPARP
jgi:cell wall-associated NlpC family hydrolase